jgi:hypothetical protein
VTLACKGLLVEEQRTNLLLNSATLSTQNVTVTAVAHTLTFYGTGTITLSGTSTAGPLVGTGVNNRVSLTFTPSAGTLTLTVTGSVTQAQIELGSFATSYIPTGAATATRNADVASVSTQAFPYSSTAGSFVANFQALGVSAGINPRIIGTELANDSSPVFTGTTTGAGTWNGAVALSVTSPNNTATAIKAAVAHDASGRAVCAASGTVSSDANTMPTFTTMKLGVGQSSATTMSGWIRQITYLPRRISNTELQTRTA